MRTTLSTWWNRTSACNPVAHAAVPWTEGRDVWYHDLVDDQPDTHAYKLHDAEDPLFIILHLRHEFGKPKGLVQPSDGWLLWCRPRILNALYDLLPITWMRTALRPGMSCPRSMTHRRLSPPFTGALPTSHG